MNTISIIVTPNYYGGTCNAPQTGLMTNAIALQALEDDAETACQHDYSNDTDAQDIWAGTLAEAEHIVDALTDGTYYLAHGEAGRPGYEIVDANMPTDAPDCVDASGADRYGDEVDADDLPDDVSKELDAANVDYQSRYNDSDDYTYEINRTETDADGDEVEAVYTILFRPTSIALQRNSDDLGNLNWSNQAYYRREQ